MSDLLTAAVRLLAVDPHDVCPGECEHCKARTALAGAVRVARAEGDDVERLTRERDDAHERITRFESLRDTLLGRLGESARHAVAAEAKVAGLAAALTSLLPHVYTGLGTASDRIRAKARDTLADAAPVLAAHVEAAVAPVRAERDRYLLAAQTQGADLAEMGRICGIRDDEYPLKAAQRVVSERDRLAQQLAGLEAGIRDAWSALAHAGQDLDVDRFTRRFMRPLRMGGTAALDAPVSVMMPEAVARLRAEACTHEGLGLPGCMTCDPRPVSEGGPPDVARCVHPPGCVWCAWCGFRAAPRPEVVEPAVVRCGVPGCSSEVDP